jgi:hypothetical protein
VPAWALEPPESAWLPVEVVVLACAFDPPVGVVGDDAVAVGADVVVDGDVVVVVDGEVVVDVLLVCNVEEAPVDLVAGEECVADVDDHLVEYALVVLPFVSDPDADTEVVVGIGAVFSAVFDEL